jgi:hypothetical protein
MGVDRGVAQVLVVFSWITTVNEDVIGETATTDVGTMLVQAHS